MRTVYARDIRAGINAARHNWAYIQGAVKETAVWGYYKHAKLTLRAYHRTMDRFDPKPKRPEHLPLVPGIKTKKEIK